VSKPFIGDNSTVSELKIRGNPKNISIALPVLFNWINGEDISDTAMYESIIKRV